VALREAERTTKGQHPRAASQRRAADAAALEEAARAASAASAPGPGVGEEDSPGPYVIINAAGVFPAAASLCDEDIVAFLHVGEVVNVLEVVRCREEGRVRGRIESPAGWITLLHVPDGFRWAEKQVARRPSRGFCGLEAAQPLRQRRCCGHGGPAPGAHRGAPWRSVARWATPGIA